MQSAQMALNEPAAFGGRRGGTSPAGKLQELPWLEAEVRQPQPGFQAHVP